MAVVLTWCFVPATLAQSHEPPQKVQRFAGPILQKGTNYLLVNGEKIVVPQAPASHLFQALQTGEGVEVAATRTSQGWVAWSIHRLANPATAAPAHRESFSEHSSSLTPEQQVPLAPRTVPRSPPPRIERGGSVLPEAHPPPSVDPFRSLLPDSHSRF